MRQIRFRAKRKDNGKWVSSSVLLTFDSKDGIMYFMPERDAYCHAFTDEDGNITELESKLFQVNPETIGQLIGEQDTNGKDIYEGDIVQHGGKVYVIRYIDHYARFVGKNKGSIFAIFAFGNSTILGNIHDNPELMEGK